jgi:2-dehydropantoate 2-reductase
MKVLVVGAGAIGGYVGAALARDGHAVTMLARGEHAAALRRRGMEIVDGPDQGVAAVEVVERLDQAPLADLVLFAVKSYDTDALAAALAPVLAPEATVLELQNGVDRAEVLESALGRGRVLAGTVFMESALDAPGVVRYLSGARRIVLGEPRGGASDRAVRVRDALRRAGLEAEAPDDVRPALWGKFVLVCAANALTALTRRPFGAIVADDRGRRVVRGVLEEGVAVAVAAGVDLGPDAVDRSLSFLVELGPALRSSMLRDAERGRRVEVDALNGHLVRRADELGVDVPRNELIAMALEIHNRAVAEQEVAP